VACEHRWQPEDIEVPGRCSGCGQSGTIIERCDVCPVVEVDYQRTKTATGRLLDRVLEHEFDSKHYTIDPGEVSIEVRECLKILEQERYKYDKETTERRRQEFEEKQRVRELQQKQMRLGGGF
jgi:hypothetical protein